MTRSEQPATAAIEVPVDDVMTVVAWWRASNESPGGCGPREALNGMGDAVFRLYQRLQQEGHHV